jgi:hypothetical protein
MVATMRLKRPVDRLAMAGRATRDQGLVLPCCADRRLSSLRRSTATFCGVSVRPWRVGLAVPLGVGTRVSGFVHGGLPKFTWLGLVAAPVAAPAPPPISAPTTTPGGPAAPQCQRQSRQLRQPHLWCVLFGVVPHAANKPSAPIAIAVTACRIATAPHMCGATIWQRETDALKSCGEREKSPRHVLSQSTRFNSANSRPTEQQRPGTNRRNGAGRRRRDDPSIPKRMSQARS